jgi:hypothetical protein
MNWWRAHHGISNDIKVGIVASRIGASKAEVGWTLIILLDYASQNDRDRGSIEGLEVDEIAAMAGIDIDGVQRIMGALRERRIISEDNRLTNWEKRQFDGDYSTDRVRKFRYKKRNETPETAAAFHETPGTSEQNRTEQSRTEETQRAPNPGALSLVVSNETPSDHAGVVRPDVPARPRKAKRTTEEIKKALGPERLPWWEGFWSVYPCHEGMRDGLDAYERLVHTRDLAVQIYNGAKAYREQIEQRRIADPAAPVKYAQGWLNAERWRDEIKPRDLTPTLKPFRPYVKPTLPQEIVDDGNTALQR